jgi:UDP:flavonoid glycosyltransferase YjiC (YdhE family)
MPDQRTPAALRSAIHEAMTMRAGAQRVAASLARAGGAASAANALETFVTTARATPGPDQIAISSG